MWPAFDCYHPSGWRKIKSANWIKGTSLFEIAGRIQALSLGSLNDISPPSFYGGGLGKAPKNWMSLSVLDYVLTGNSLIGLAWYVWKLQTNGECTCRRATCFVFLKGDGVALAYLLVFSVPPGYSIVSAASSAFLPNSIHLKTTCWGSGCKHAGWSKALV